MAARRKYATTWTQWQREEDLEIADRWEFPEYAPTPNREQVISAGEWQSELQDDSTINPKVHALPARLDRMAIEHRSARILREMLARHYQPEDAAGIDRMGLGDVRIDRDRIVVAGKRNELLGCLVWRPGSIVHELRVGCGVSRRNVADSLSNFAIADAVARQWYLCEGIFVTDSDAMAKYAMDIGAVEETGKRVFTLALR